MLLHADASQCIETPYQMITINYFPTSVKRLYQIGSTTGEWQEYQNIPIKVNQGQTIYAKGIDKYGNQTRIISSHTVNVENALTSAAYDGDENTCDTGPIYSVWKRLEVDSSLWNKKIYIKLVHASNNGNIEFYDENNKIIPNTAIKVNYGGGNVNGSVQGSIPTGAKYAVFNVSTSIYEVKILSWLMYVYMFYGVIV